MIEVCRDHGVSDASVYKCKARVWWDGGLGRRWLKAPDDENAKPKKFLAEAVHDSAMLPELAARKWSRAPNARPPLICTRSTG